ncbi:zinc ribbon domain-containing protein [Streptomyces canus]|uniref:zinc ribbon domain-containing protein n=1 Tax=Streptomyces canus TaxID=58343 RepID=UPI0038679E5A
MARRCPPRRTTRTPYPGRRHTARSRSRTRRPDHTFTSGAVEGHIRVWECGACGAELDRDINAAVNVAKAAGLAVPACGAQVRPVLVPAQRGEAGTHRDGQPTVAGISSL